MEIEAPIRSIGALRPSELPSTSPRAREEKEQKRRIHSSRKIHGNKYDEPSLLPGGGGSTFLRLAFEVGRAMPQQSKVGDRSCVPCMLSAAGLARASIDRRLDRRSNLNVVVLHPLLLFLLMITTD